MAARIHDSVLQSLALIQRNAGDSRQVTNLARRQERELRDWLFGPTEAPSAGFRESLRKAAADVEDLTGVKVDIVVVGDRPWTDRVEAMVLAGREALLNAAKHAGVDMVSVYGEAGDAGMTIFVRDRGTGFDPSSIGPAGTGIDNSMVARLGRHGGTVAIDSDPGSGTEVKLEWVAR